MCIRDSLQPLQSPGKVALHADFHVRNDRLKYNGRLQKHSLILCRNVDALATLIEPCLLIDEGELDKDRDVKVVQEIAPVLKDGSFVLVLRKMCIRASHIAVLSGRCAQHLCDGLGNAGLFSND